MEAMLGSAQLTVQGTPPSDTDKLAAGGNGVRGDATSSKWREPESRDAGKAPMTDSVEEEARVSGPARAPTDWKAEAQERIKGRLAHGDAASVAFLANKAYGAGHARSSASRESSVTVVAPAPPPIT